ncbi:unnamed protein product [Arctogadus glacialis]
MPHASCEATCAKRSEFPCCFRSAAACRQRVTLAPRDVRTRHSASSKFRASRGSLSRRHKSLPPGSRGPLAAVERRGLQIENLRRCQRGDSWPVQALEPVC